MAKNRIKVCWLLLLVLMYTASFLMSIGESQARYLNTVTGSVLVETKAPGITSNCLVTEDQPPLTVLVGELSLYKPTTVSFWLHSSGADATGNLAWSVADKDHAQYLQVTMKSGPDVIEPNMEVGLLRDVYMDISMILTPTEIARNTVHDQLKIQVLVTWGEEMWGTFQVILPEVAGEENEDPEKISGETTGETGSSQQKEAAATNSMKKNQQSEARGYGVSLLSSTTPLVTGETTETTKAPEETTTPTEETTEPTEKTTEPTEETTQPTEETTEPTEETTEPTQAPEEPEEEPLDPIRLSTLPSFDPSEMVPVQLYMTEDVTAVQLGLLVEDEKATEDPDDPVMEFKPFPDYTKFSVNQGESFYMMYDGYIAEFALQAQTELPLLLDFSLTELEEEEPLILAMQAYAGDELVCSAQAEITPDAPENFQTMTRPLVQTVDETETQRPAATQTGGVNILSQYNALEFNLPMEWLDAEVEYTVDRLTMTQEQKLEYVPVTLSAKELKARYVDYDLTHQVVLQVGETLPSAGTYRLNLKWSYEGICYAQTQTTFFINYSAQTNYTLSG